MIKKTVQAIDFYKNQITVNLGDLNWRPAAYGVVIKDNKILLLKQINGYDLPGGGLEYGETPSEAVIREVKEETGIEVASPKLIDCGTAFLKSFSKDKFYQAITIYYECLYRGGELSTDGFDEYEKIYAETPVWLELEQLDHIKMGSYREFRDVVKKAVNNENYRH